MIVVCVDVTGSLYEPHEEGLQALVVLLESGAGDISLGRIRQKQMSDMV